MRMSWSRNEARAATHLVKVRGESERQNGRTQYWYASPESKPQELPVMRKNEYVEVFYLS